MRIACLPSLSLSLFLSLCVTFSAPEGSVGKLGCVLLMIDVQLAVRGRFDALRATIASIIG